MSSLAWMGFFVGGLVLTAANVIVVYWLNRRRRAAIQAGDAEREALKAEMEMLREENARLRSAFAKPVDERPAISPYSRAIEMARNGDEINRIASVCGITRGEAELIVALHRSGISSS